MFFFRLPQSEHNKKCYAELKWAVFKLSTKKKGFEWYFEKKNKWNYVFTQSC